MLRDPCKRCIVRACCTLPCGVKRKYWDKKERVEDWLRRIVPFCMGSVGIFALVKLFLLLSES